jgi:circadian clock protein KaiC
MTTSPSKGEREGLEKVPTGIHGLDEITGGGLPRGRPTLVCGSAGCGKTLLAMEFLVRGAEQFGEPGVFMSFEEHVNELVDNARSLGFDLGDLRARKLLAIDYVRVERSEIEETGDYDLEGLFVRIGHAIDEIGAKRIVLDTVETLFAGLSNDGILRAELRRLFRWLKDRGVSAVITGERGDGQLTRHGLEEYVSDCVILLDHRVIDQISTRRLRIVKYRGSYHGTNEYPFLIDEDGISILPITSLNFEHTVSSERVATGIPQLDHMLGGRGYFRGSTILVSGPSGSGKSSIAAHFVHAACGRDEPCLFFAFEESPGQIVRNMRSIGIDLEPWIRKGLLHLNATRAGGHGLEAHLLTFYKRVQETGARVVVLDPIGNLTHGGSLQDTTALLIRLIDFLKSHGVTALLTDLTHGGTKEKTETNISSLADTWLLLRDVELGGERNRALYVLKSRGMDHSNQIREFLLTDRGIDLVNAYLGPDGVLTGSMRVVQESREKAAALVRTQEIQAKRREWERKREALESRIAAMRKEFEADSDELELLIEQAEDRRAMIREDEGRMAASRRARDATNGNEPSPRPGHSAKDPAG